MSEPSQPNPNKGRQPLFRGFDYHTLSALSKAFLKQFEKYSETDIFRADVYRRLSDHYLDTSEAIRRGVETGGTNIVYLEIQDCRGYDQVIQELFDDINARGAHPQIAGSAQVNQNPRNLDPLDLNDVEYAGLERLQSEIVRNREASRRINEQGDTSSAV